MTPLVNYLLLGCLALYSLVLLVEALSGKRSRTVALEGGGLVAFLVILHLTTGFPTPARAFGGFSPLSAIAIMFGSVLTGIASQYVFYRKGRFTLRSFLKPMVISPIVLLPLLGSLQGITALEPIQLISFALLSFQNGFFWQTVLEREKV